MISFWLAPLVLGLSVPLAHAEMTCAQTFQQVASEIEGLPNGSLLDLAKYSVSEERAKEDCLGGPCSWLVSRILMSPLSLTNAGFSHTHRVKLEKDYRMVANILIEDIQNEAWQTSARALYNEVPVRIDLNTFQNFLEGARQDGKLFCRWDRNDNRWLASRHQNVVTKVTQALVAQGYKTIQTSR